MTFKIYTKTGDQGKTSLIGGTRVPKSNTRIDAYGTIDELNSYIGLLHSMATTISSKKILKEIQDRLFTIGSSLACDPDKEVKMSIPDLKEIDILLLENEIDAMNQSLPDLRYFILPGGNQHTSFIHITRCVCRKAERICVEMQELKLFILPIIIVYLNRLSDYLFVLSRHESYLQHVVEEAWHPRIEK